MLVLSGIGVPPYSARGLTRRCSRSRRRGARGSTVNGTLVDLSLAQFRKYRSLIRCSDQDCTGTRWNLAGQFVTCELRCRTLLSITGTPTKPVVSGSQRTEGSFIFYRPQLTMQVVGLTMEKDEYAATPAGRSSSWRSEHGLLLCLGSMVATPLWTVSMRMSSPSSCRIWRASSLAECGDPQSARRPC